MLSTSRFAATRMLIEEQSNAEANVEGAGEARLGVTKGLTIDRYYHEEGYDFPPHTENGPAGYYDDEGTYWGDEPLDYILRKVFGFCGCGDPEAAGRYIRDGLQDVADNTTWVRAKGYEYDTYTWKIADEGERYFLWYVLDQTGLTEHGGSVPGWLSVEGLDVLHDLNMIFTEEQV